MTDDLRRLPEGLPAPEDDGAADHLRGASVPEVALRSTIGQTLTIAAGARPALVFAFPWAGRPGEALPEPGWDAIPGARGCTAEACAFRDVNADLRVLGLDVLGVSVQSPAALTEVATRLGLRYPLLSDEGLELARAIGLPTFTAGGRTLLRRLTVLVRDGRVERVWYPVFPPDRHPERVLAALAGPGSRL